MGESVKLTDNRKVFKSVYQLKPGIIEKMDIPDLNFLIIDTESIREDIAEGDPHLVWVTSRIQNQLRIITSKRMQYNFRLMPGECIWHYQLPSGKWYHTLMVQLPELIDDVLFKEAIENVRKKNKHVDFTAPRFERISQGVCAQKLHLGHYSEIKNTVEEIVNHVTKNGFRVRGTVREIYMNAAGWNPVEKWQTIVRIPIEQNT